LIAWLIALGVRLSSAAALAKLAWRAAASNAATERSDGGLMGIQFPARSTRLMNSIQQRGEHIEILKAVAGSKDNAQEISQ
jgi:hypothetical protein